MVDVLLDLLFPRRSLTGQPGAWLTDEERIALRPAPVLIGRTALRARGLTALDRLAAGCPYDQHPLLRRAIARLKYGRVRAMAQPLAALAQNALPPLVDCAGTVLCPVPLHWTRHFARGFNQSQLLCEALASAALPAVVLLRRARRTGRQVGRDRPARLASLRGAFRCTGRTPTHVILVDDVCTTGATLDACAAALKDGGAARVSALVVACVP